MAIHNKERLNREKYRPVWYGDLALCLHGDWIQFSSEQLVDLVGDLYALVMKT